MKTKLKKAALWLRRIAHKLNPSKATRKLSKEAALWLLREVLKEGIKAAIKTAPDWLPVVWDWLA